MKIYVGNLPYDFTEEELKDMFDQFGEVASAKIIADNESGRSKGFGFIEMERKSEGKDAIQALDESAVRGRNVKVHVARPRNGRPQRNRKKRNGDARRSETVDAAAEQSQKKEDVAVG